MSRNSSEAIVCDDPRAASFNYERAPFRHPSSSLNEFELMKSRVLRSFKKTHVIGMFVLAVGFLGNPVTPSAGNAQDAESREIDGVVERSNFEIRIPKD